MQMGVCVLVELCICVCMSVSVQQEEYVCESPSMESIVDAIMAVNGFHE